MFKPHGMLRRALAETLLRRAGQYPVVTLTDPRDQGAELVPVEIKAGETVTRDSFAGLAFFRELSGDPNGPAALVYAGDRTFEQHGVKVYGWQGL